MKDFLAKRKAHLVFGSALLFILALNIVLALTPGQTVIVTIWKGFSSIRPVEYLMFGGFWYACHTASQRRLVQSPYFSQSFALGHRLKLQARSAEGLTKPCS
jgi:hypothetical protein